MDDNITDNLRGIIGRVKATYNAAYEQYSAAVELVLSDRITDEKRISELLDGLCDFCDEDRFIDLYKKVCRHVFYRYPSLIADYISIPKQLWMTDDDEAD